MAKTIRAGIVGCGHLGRYHAKIYAALPDVDLVGVCDSDSVAAGKVAKAGRSRVYANVPDLLPHVDVLSVATPARTHYQVVKPILKAGKHALVEKPIAHNVRAARELSALARKHRVRLCVGHIERFNPAYQTLLAQKPKPRFIEAHRLATPGARGLDVDVILDLMIHDIDLVLHLVGRKVASVHASGMAVASGSLDIANARLGFEGGCTANLTASRISGKQMRKLRIFQPGAYYSLDFSAPSMEMVKISGVKAGKGRLPSFAQSRTSLPKVNALHEEIAAFLQVVRGKSDRLLASADAATLALAIAERVERRCGPGGG